MNRLMIAYKFFLEIAATKRLALIVLGVFRLKRPFCAWNWIRRFLEMEPVVFDLKDSQGSSSARYVWTNLPDQVQLSQPHSGTHWISVEPERTLRNLFFFHVFLIKGIEGSVVSKSTQKWNAAASKRIFDGISVGAGLPAEPGRHLRAVPRLERGRQRSRSGRATAAKVSVDRAGSGGHPPATAAGLFPAQAGTRPPVDATRNAQSDAPALRRSALAVADPLLVGVAGPTFQVQSPSHGPRSGISQIPLKSRLTRTKRLQTNEAIYNLGWK